jgi:hypothetical protein
MGSIKIFSVFLLLAVCSALPAQNRKYTVAGVVVDSLTGKPMKEVNISVVGASGNWTTNQAGEFTVQVQRLPSVLYFSYVGYSIGNCLAEKSGEKNIRIAMLPETREISEVTITGEKITKLIKGDTLNIIDFEIEDDRIVIFASLYKNLKDQRLYLANLKGDTLSHLQVSNAGKEIKFPEIMMPKTEFLVRDFTGKIQFLDKDCAHEVNHYFDRLTFGYDTQYSDFIGRVIPIKCEMEGKLVFQVATVTGSYTFFYGRGSQEGTPIKFIQDKKANSRYVSKELMAMAPHDADFNKRVSAPMFRKGKELFVFDFFSDHFEVFDSNLNPVRKVPISFQNVNVIDGLVFRIYSVDVDTKNFDQNILFDEKAGKAYAFFRYKSDNKQYLKEISLETGQIDRVIPIPEFSNISNVRVYDNALYFLYDTKVYPYYRQLYRMVI